MNLAYSCSRDSEKIVPADSEAAENGQVSTALWFTYGSNCDNILSRTSMLQRSRSPKTRKCDSREPSTPESGGQRWKYKRRVHQPIKPVQLKTEADSIRLWTSVPGHSSRYVRATNSICDPTCFPI